MEKLTFISICLVTLQSAKAHPTDVRKENEMDRKLLDKFPNDFLFGAASSAYQVEGAWNVDGKGQSIWDDFVHYHPEKIADRTNPDYGANSYEHYEDDIRACKSLELNFYRFSISWSRILPTGDIAHINELGIDYYNKVINKTLEYKLMPMITMYHWDLPSSLQKFGGWTNPLMIRYFKEYADLLFERFGDRVKLWITFNEPYSFCLWGYGTSYVAPAMDAPGVGDYLCGHNVLKAHAAVYHLYKEKYFGRFNGQISISLNSNFFYSRTNNTKDVDFAMQFSLGWFAHPIYSAEGGYPTAMVSRIAKNSKQEGRLSSRLPTFLPEEVNYIRGSSDYFAINHYTSRYVELENFIGVREPSYYNDRALNLTVDPTWKRGRSEWAYMVPQGLRDLLRWIKHEYNNPTVLITEHGWSGDDRMIDNDRVELLYKSMKDLLKVLSNDECNLKGYTVWSIIDNWEWANGFLDKFGVFAVNMTSPQRERIPKLSASFLRDLIHTRKVPESYCRNNCS